MTKATDNLASTSIGAAGDVFLIGFALVVIGGAALLFSSIIFGW